MKPVSIPQTHLAILSNSRSASEMAVKSEREVTRSGNNQGDRGCWEMLDGGISFQSLRSRSFFEPDHHYQQMRIPPARTGSLFSSHHHLHVNTYPTATLLCLDPLLQMLVDRIGVMTVACI